MSSTAGLPTDAAVCAAIEFYTKRHVELHERLRCVGWYREEKGLDPGASAGNMAYLYGNNTRRAAAQLPRLVRAGLLQRVRIWPEKVSKTLGFALTADGFALAVTERHPCSECLAPVEPDPTYEWPHICRACAIERYERVVRVANQRVEWELEQVEEAERMAIRAREGLEALKGGEA